MTLAKSSDLALDRLLELVVRGLVDRSGRVVGGRGAREDVDGGLEIWTGET